VKPQLTTSAFGSVFAYGALSMSNQRKEQALFQVRFARCHRLLHFIACCVLSGAERTEEVIERCRLRASLSPQRFEYEGAFRSWLLRLLIDEALAVLRRSQEDAGGHDIVAERRDSRPRSPA
jgi:DNA-directed RNA polymerase specialized sigma24 family protein